MSLELAIQENTAAINRLAEMMAEMRASPVVVAPISVSAPTAPAHPDKPASPTTANLPVGDANASPSEAQSAAVIPNRKEVSDFFVNKFVPKAGREAALATLAKHDVKKVSDIPEGDERLAKLFAEIKAAVEAK